MKRNTNQSTAKIQYLVATLVLMLSLWRNLKYTCEGHIKIIGEGWHHENDQAATSHIIGINEYQTKKQ
jgi:hypothetical protein